MFLKDLGDTLATALIGAVIIAGGIVGATVLRERRGEGPFRPELVTQWVLLITLLWWSALCLGVVLRWLLAN